MGSILVATIPFRQPKYVALLWALPTPTGRLLHCQVEHHVRDKFATPILYGIDNFKFYDIFYIYLTIDNIFCVFFLNFLAISILYSNCFSSILRHSS